MSNCSFYLFCEKIYQFKSETQSLVAALVIISPCSITDSPVSQRGVSGESSGFLIDLVKSQKWVTVFKNFRKTSQPLSAGVWCRRQEKTEVEDNRLWPYRITPRRMMTSSSVLICVIQWLLWSQSNSTSLSMAHPIIPSSSHLRLLLTRTHASRTQRSV